MNNEKVVLITGASSGMGKASAIEMARQGYRTVMLCRDKDRGEQALNEVIKDSGNNDVYMILCDLGSFSDIKECCNKFKAEFMRLDVLINNAGVILPGRQTTVDGFELQFGVNHLGHFLLTNMLLDIMEKSAPSRIVNVSSGAHKAGKIHFDDINLEKRYSLFKAYSQSKLANVLFTYELSRRLEGSGVTANCLHPGAVATQMGINRNTGFGTFITSVLKPFFLTPEQGAQTAIYLATSPEVQGITGKYFYRKRPIPSSKRSNDKHLAKGLWELSEKFTGI